MGIDMEMHYLRTVEGNLSTLPEGYDICVVHDPQPMAIPTCSGRTAFRVAKKWIWRCHIDCADPHPDIWGFIKRFLEPYDAMVFTMKEFVQPEVPGDRVVISAPSIDPTSPKNSDLSDVTVNDICRQYQVDSASSDPRADLALRPVEGPRGRHHRVPDR